MNTFRMIKLLALSALALVALGALSATAAQAGTFTAGAYPATITGSTAAGAHEMKTQLGTMNCGPSFHGVMEAASETLTLTPNYGTTCSIGGNQVHVKNNGCDFRLHAGATKEVDVITGSMDIVCPAESKMDFEITSATTCHLTIPAQNNLGTLTYTNNTAAQDVNLDFKLEFFFYELDVGCSTVGAFFDGFYGGTSTLKADAGGAGTSFQVD